MAVNQIYQEEDSDVPPIKLGPHRNQTASITNKPTTWTHHK